MSTISVDYDVLNQKGSPAWFTDTFANIPTFGFVGRMFISTDTFAFYRDTGTGWDLIGGPGIGTLTGSGATGQVSFFNGTQVLTGNNNLFWDNTNSRLGINTATPSAPLDIHGTGTQLQLNGTAANNSYIVFQNSGASKWRIGNLSPANSFEIYNAATSSYALTIASATNEVVIGQKLTVNGIITTLSTLSNGTYFYTLPSATGTLAILEAGTQTFTGTNTFSAPTNFDNVIRLKQSLPSFSTSSGYTTLFSTQGGGAYGFGFYNGGGVVNFLDFSTTTGYTYTFPSATGTLALTSNLSSYLPLTGGTLTGALTGTTALFNTSAQIGGSSYNLAKLNVQGLQGTYLLDLTNGTEGEWKLRVYNNGSGAGAGIVFKQGLFFDNTENAAINYYRGTFSNNGSMSLATAGVDRLNISTAGFIGIGNTNTTYKFDVTGDGRFTSNLTASSFIKSGGTSAQFLKADGSVDSTTYLSTTAASTTYLPLAGGTMSGQLQINANNNSFIQKAATSGQAVYWEIFNSSNASRSYIGYGANSSSLFSFVNREAGAMDFYTNSIKRLTINSSGGVNIGTSTWTNGLSTANLDMNSVGIFGYSDQLYIFNNTYHDGSTGFYYKYTGSGVGGMVVENAGNIVFATAPSGTAGNLVTLTTRMTITQAGNIGAPSGTNIYNASDLRLKKNISTINNGLDKILALNPVKFNWIDGFEPSEDGKDMLGFIAQEVQNIIPESVENFANNSVIIGDVIVDNALRVNEKFIIPVLVKAIQELNEKLIKNNIN